MTGGKFSLPTGNKKFSFTFSPTNQLIGLDGIVRGLTITQLGFITFNTSCDPLPASTLTSPLIPYMGTTSKTVKPYSYTGVQVVVAFFIVIVGLGVIVAILAAIKCYVEKRSITPVLAETTKLDEEAVDSNQLQQIKDGEISALVPLNSVIPIQVENNKADNITSDQK